MKKITKAFSKIFSYNLLSLYVLNVFLLSFLSQLVWGTVVPPTGSLSIWEYVGLAIGLSTINLSLERIPEPMRKRK